HPRARLVDVGDRHRGSVCRERLRDAAPDAAAPARHQRDLALEQLRHLVVIRRFAMCGSRAEADYNVFHMDIGYTEEQEALRQELRAYYAELLTPEVEEQLAHANGVGEAMRAVVRR